ncbi:MAG TPA: hypothetical protein PKB02_02510 [Anaerohalosphaeraceae bacterium]|nr:hypothetical protein [Anaerohalosphaeraceae bacterium]
MKTVAFWLLVFIPLLAGCGKDPITEGEIYEKIYEPAHTDTYLQPIMVCDGETTSVTWLPMTEYDDEDFIIRFKAYVDGEHRTRTLFVNKQIYERVSVGDWFVLAKFEDMGIVEECDHNVKHREQSCVKN